MEIKFDYVVDLSTVIYSDQDEAAKIIKNNSNISSEFFKNPLDVAYSAFFGFFKLCENIITDESSLTKELTCHLNNFLNSLELPDEIKYTHNTDIYIEDRSTNTYNKSAKPICALMCTKTKDYEKLLREYVLKEFKTTKHTRIQSLSETFKKVLSTTIEFMFSENVNDIMNIDTKALKIMLDLQKKHTTAFVYNMPGYVDLKNINGKNTSLLIGSENSLLTKDNFFISGNIGHLTTDPLFYENIPLTKKPTHITTCNSNTLALRDKGTFAKLYFYNYIEHKKLEDVLKSE